MPEEPRAYPPAAALATLHRPTVPASLSSAAGGTASAASSRRDHSPLAEHASPRLWSPQMPARRACLGRSGVLVDAMAVLAGPVIDGVRHPLDADREQIEGLLCVRQVTGSVGAACALPAWLRSARQLVSAC